MDKKCSTCNELKPLNQFYKQKGRTGTSSCKKCFNSYCADRWISRKIQALDYKGNACVDCGLSFPTSPYVIFDFHHIIPSEKDVDWSKLRLRSWEKIKIELDKCVVLCANCHRIRHHNNMHSQEDSNP